jgi:hypothetical protein
MHTELSNPETWSSAQDYQKGLPEAQRDRDNANVFECRAAIPPLYMISSKQRLFSAIVRPSSGYWLDAFVSFFDLGYNYGSHVFRHSRMRTVL